MFSIWFLLPSLTGLNTANLRAACGDKLTLIAVMRNNPRFAVSQSRWHWPVEPKGIANSSRRKKWADNYLRHSASEYPTEENSRDEHTCHYVHVLHTLLTKLVSLFYFDVFSLENELMSSFPFPNFLISLIQMMSCFIRLDFNKHHLSSSGYSASASLPFFFDKEWLRNTRCHHCTVIFAQFKSHAI